MAECDGKSVSLQFAVPTGHCDGLRRIAMDFLRDSGAEQEVKSLRSWGSADQGSESLGGHSATGNRRARSCQGAQYLSLAQVRWTSKILMVP